MVPHELLLLLSAALFLCAFAPNRGACVFAEHVAVVLKSLNISPEAAAAMMNMPVGELRKQLACKAHLSLSKLLRLPPSFHDALANQSALRKDLRV